MTLIENNPAVLKKDKNKVLEQLLELAFKLMIDIDEEIDSEWLNPAPGHVIEEKDEQDNITFVQDIIDRLVDCMDPEVILPLIGTLVQNTLANEKDWRYKHAGILAFSQVVTEFIEDTE